VLVEQENAVVEARLPEVPNSSTSATSQNWGRDFQLEMISQVLACFDTNLILNVAKCVGTFEHFAMESFDLGASVPHYPRLGPHFTARFTTVKFGIDFLNLSISKTPLVCTSDLRIPYIKSESSRETKAHHAYSGFEEEDASRMSYRPHFS
jgi:hypothetical protein